MMAETTTFAVILVVTGVGDGGDDVRGGHENDGGGGDGDGDKDSKLQ